MTPEQQRIVIAEFCGWKYNGLGPIGTLHHPTECHCFDGLPCIIPDYPNDLNAMHDAEEKLRKNQFHYVDYTSHLFSIVTGMKWNGSNMGYFFFNYTHSTAAQRAEALLKTIGKWKD